MDADAEEAAFEAIVRQLLSSIARAADGGDLSGTPQQAVEAVSLSLISDAALGLLSSQRLGVLTPPARLIGEFLDEIEREAVAA